MERTAKSKDESIILSYKTLGYGDETILAFHGFGHSKEDFSMIEPFLSGKERIIAIDLFGHGEAFFPESRMKNEPISKDEWRILIEDILIREKVTKFHLIGYSLGGRMALVTFELFKERVKSVFLFSPDGLHKTRSFAFANESKIALGYYPFEGPVTRDVNGARFDCYVVGMTLSSLCESFRLVCWIIKCVFVQFPTATMP